MLPAVRPKVPVLPVSMYAASSGGDMLLRMEKLFAGKVRMLQYAQIDFDQFLDVADIRALVGCRERDGAALVAGAPCAADAVHVILDVFRKVVVNDKFYADHINAPRRDICRDKYPVFAPFKTFECFPALH
jgi:hypothetical protein